MYSTLFLLENYLNLWLSSLIFSPRFNEGIVTWCFYIICEDIKHLNFRSCVASTASMNWPWAAYWFWLWKDHSDVPTCWKCSVLEPWSKDFLSSLVVTTQSPMQGVLIQTQIRKLRSHMLWTELPKIRKRKKETRVGKLEALLIKEIGNHRNLVRSPDAISTI